MTTDTLRRAAPALPHLRASLAGVLVEGPGYSTAFVVASAFAGFGALLVFVRRRTLAGPVPA